MVTLGEFDPNLEFYREVDWFVFFICIFFNIVVLFNLLIAIISETYTRISEEKAAFSYKEKVFMMSLLQDGIFGYMKKPSNPLELIFVAQVI